MKITWKWLGDYVDLSGLEPEKVADDLTNAGISVEKIVALNQGVSGVVVGYIVSTSSHPEADRLKICQVDAGKGDLLQIVTGATNVFAGQKVPVALVGAKLPEKDIGMATFRNVESAGMLCSARELGLDDRYLPKEQAEGILIFPEDAPTGESVIEYLGLDDTVLELELTPNRSDCLSVRGVAYEVGAIYSRTVKMPELYEADLAKGELPLSVRIDTPNCTGYSAQVISGLQLGSSPMWMQMRLLAVGMRPINNLVDITNYVMFEWGQPLHAFDYSAITHSEIVVRQASDKEVVQTLDSQERELTSEVIVIADPVRPLGLAGVMGGENSEVKGATHTVVVESALFNPLITRRTSKRLQLRSEASLRFEKGLDREAVLPALLRAASLMARYAGGKVAGHPVITGSELLTPTPCAVIRVRPDRVEEVLGYRVSNEEIDEICKRLDLDVERMDGNFMVKVPPRRQDLLREEDMIEEFARLLGFDRIPSTTLEGVLTHGHLSREQKLRRVARDHLRGNGFHEVWTYSFLAKESYEKVRLSETHPKSSVMNLLNPLSEDRSALRSTMLMPLLDVAQYNASRQMSSLRAFEIGNVFLHKESAMKDNLLQPEEKLMIAAIVYGEAGYEPLYGHRNYDFYDLKGMVESLLVTLGVDQKPEYVRSQEPYFHPGRAVQVHFGDQVAGAFGQLHREVIKNFDLPIALYLELDFEVLVKQSKTLLYVQQLPRYPQVERDLALVVQRSLPVGSLLQTVRQAAGKHLESLQVFDVYTGEHVGQEEKSVAIRLIFRSSDHTLTESEVQSYIANVLSETNSQYEAILRK